MALQKIPLGTGPDTSGSVSNNTAWQTHNQNMDAIDGALEDLEERATELEERAAGAFPAAGGQYQGQVASKVVALVEAPTVATDASKGNAFTLLLTGDRMLGNPTGMAPGAAWTWTITQDAVGGRRLTFDTAWRWTGRVVPVLSQAPNAEDVISAFSPDGIRILATFLPDFG